MCPFFMVDMPFNWPNDQSKSTLLPWYLNEMEHGTYCTKIATTKDLVTQVWKSNIFPINYCRYKLWLFKSSHLHLCSLFVEMQTNKRHFCFFSNISVQSWEGWRIYGLVGDMCLMTFRSVPLFTVDAIQLTKISQLYLVDILMEWNMEHILQREL